MMNWGKIAEAAAVATANGFNVGTPHRGRHGIMKRVVEAMIDEALDEAKARSEQRVAVYWARNRAFAAVEEYLENRSAALQQVLALFESDHIDLPHRDTLRAQRDAEHRRVADAIAQSAPDVRAVLSPTQRKAVADYARARLGLAAAV